MSWALWETVVRLRGFAQSQQESSSPQLLVALLSPDARNDLGNYGVLFGLCFKAKYNDSSHDNIFSCLVMVLCFMYV